MASDLQRAYDEGYARAIEDIKLAHRPQTNADHIRAMTDEELATWGATKIPCCPPGADLNELCFPKYHGCGGNSDLAIRCWLTWLKQEAQDD